MKKQNIKQLKMWSTFLCGVGTFGIAINPLFSVVLMGGFGMFVLARLQE